MSRFFRAGESDSDDTGSDYTDDVSGSDSGDHSDSDSDDQPAARGPANRLLGAGSDDSDSDEDVIRVVRSAKDKRFKEIEQAVTTMANGQKINDWVSAQNGKDQWIKGSKDWGDQGPGTRNQGPDQGAGGYLDDHQH